MSLSAFFGSGAMVMMLHLFAKSSRASATALKNCQAMASDIALVLPLPVAIFTQ